MVEVIYKALLSGAPADDVQALIAGLTGEDRDMLLCMLSGIRNELEATCVERAHEVDRVLLHNGFVTPDTPPYKPPSNRIKAGRVR